ncbi:MAG: aldehyde ferredoxin oxidoreductase family protein [Bacillota bacterium]
MAKGYMGKVLLVDLTTGQILEQIIPDEVYKTVLSGLGLGAWYLYNNIPAGADPLGPDNILGFTSGMLTGTSAFYSGRFMVVCKSPASGGWNDSNCGGNFAPAIKECGYDAIFFKGISDKPVYLLIDNNGPRLMEAAHVWGMDAVETEQVLIKENWIKKRPRVACIGPAGEKLSLISGVMNDGGRAAARGGQGAVMGSKRLKAVVLCGTKRVQVADLETIIDINKAQADKIREQNLPEDADSSIFLDYGKYEAEAEMDGTRIQAPSDGYGMVAGLKRWGTAAWMSMSLAGGNTPSKNWSVPTPEGMTDENMQAFQGNITSKREFKRYHCHACPIGCGGTVDISNVRDGKFKESHRAEYETLASFGSMNFNFDVDSVYYANELCNRGGMDTISAGCTISFAMELWEKGIITSKDTNGIDLTWGNIDGIIGLLEKMIAREGIGDVFADGIKVAAERIGGEAPLYAVHAGGIEPGLHSGVKKPIMGLHYVIDPTPGRHMTADTGHHMLYQAWKQVDWMEEPAPYNVNLEFVPNRKIAEIAALSFMERMLVDCVGACMIGSYMGWDSWRIFDYLNAVTGWEKEPGDYIYAGKAVMAIRQLFQFKHGIDPTNIYVHPRMLGPYKSGPLQWHQVPLEGMRTLEWDYLGWDPQTGKPTEESIAAMDLDKILDIQLESSSLMKGVE